MIKFDDGFYNVKLDFILSLSGKDILENQKNISNYSLLISALIKFSINVFTIFLLLKSVFNLLRLLFNSFDI